MEREKEPRPVELREAEVVLHMPPMSKPRPRSYMRQARPYNPPAYKQWLCDMRSQMAEWWVEPPLEKVITVWMQFYGPQRGDIDNLQGAVFDAGNQLIWKDDRVGIIPFVEAKWQKARIKESRIYLKIIWEAEV